MSGDICACHTEAALLTSGGWGPVMLLDAPPCGGRSTTGSHLAPMPPLQRGRDLGALIRAKWQIRRGWGVPSQESL